MKPRKIKSPWKPFLPFQREAFTWQPAHGIGTIALLGGWGSGKTHGAARLAFRLACENPWTPEYGDDNPLGLIVAPTNKILQYNTARQYRSVCPPGTIRKELGLPHPSILMTNGFKWLLVSADAKMEGFNVCAVWIDEISDPVFTNDPELYDNYLKRIRDPLGKSFRMIVSGLPTHGFVRDTFDKDGPQDKCILAGTLNNTYLPKQVRDRYKQDCPSGTGYIGDQWIAPSDIVYPQYRSETHLTDEDYDASKPVILGIDVGNLGAVLAAQEVDVPLVDDTGNTTAGKGLRIIWQHLSESESIQSQLQTLKREHPTWRVSVICTDPMIRRDEYAAIETAYPQALIIKRQKGHSQFPVETGIAVVQRGLRDYLGNVRIKFNRRLARDPRGIVSFLTKYRRQPRTQDPVKDNRTDHVGDCLRYIACYSIPLMQHEIRVDKLR